MLNVMVCIMSNGSIMKLTPTNTPNYQIHSSNKSMTNQTIQLHQILASASAVGWKGNNRTSLRWRCRLGIYTKRGGKRENRLQIDIQISARMPTTPFHLISTNQTTRLKTYIMPPLLLFSTPPCATLPLAYSFLPLKRKKWNAKRPICVYICALLNYLLECKRILQLCSHLTHWHKHKMFGHPSSAKKQQRKG